jgi:hypothetical protein
VKLAAARVLDGWAVGLSGLCLVHCLALPVLAVLLPALGAWTHSEWMHVVFVLIAAPLSGLALLRPTHGRATPAPLIGLGGLGVLLLALGAFGPDAADIPATVAGSFSLVAAHLWNWRRHTRMHLADV